MFSYEHIFFMIIEVIAIGGICLKVRNIEHNVISTFCKRITFLIIMFDPIYWIWEIIQYGNLRWETTLPLYLCSLFWILMPFVAFSPKGKRLNRVAMSCVCTVCLLGGILGTVFNVYINMYSFLSFVVIRSLIYHFFMMLIPAILWCTGYYKPQIEDAFLAFTPVLVLLIPCLIVDRQFGWDYCYLNGGIGTPLEMISKSMPISTFVILLYGGLLLVVNVVFYIPTITRYMNISQVEEISCEK